MRRVLTGALAAVLPALLVSAMTIGCSGDNKDKGSDNTKKKPEPEKKKEPVDSKGWGTLKGKVTLADDPPNLQTMTDSLQKQMKDNKQDGDFCLSGSADEKSEQLWEPRNLKKDGGVKNVFVWLQPPDEDHFFKVDLTKKTWPEEAFIDQPHCAFEPHAVVLFPGSFEGGDELHSSGQKFVVKNGATILHNTKWNGGTLNPGGSERISPKKELEVKGLVPSPDPLSIKCDVHGWMTGVARIFDHPYATLTREDGTFEIKNAPAGAEVRVVVWHEAGLYGSTGKDGDKVTLKDGETTEKKYTVSAPK